MSVRNSSVSTAGPSPAGIGLVANFASYSFTETASDSASIVMMGIPAGARILDVTLTINNNQLDTTGGGQVSVATWMGGGADKHLYITTGSGSLQTAVFKPLPGHLGYRHTSSANLVVQLMNFVNTGTASTIFAVSVIYDCQLRGD